VTLGAVSLSPSRYRRSAMNNRFLTGPATRRKTACPELGHVFGLGHRSGGRTCMRDGFATMYGHPDAGDDARLRAIYR
jgi:hypothetical protein